MNYSTADHENMPEGAALDDVPMLATDPGDMPANLLVTRISTTSVGGKGTFPRYQKIIPHILQKLSTMVLVGRFLEERFEGRMMPRSQTCRQRQPVRRRSFLMLQ